MIKPISKIAIEKVSSEIFVRNLEAQFTASNLATRKTAAVPELGIFWIQEQSPTSFKIVGRGCKPRDGEFIGGMKVNPQNHFELWSEIQKENKIWIGKNYMSVPRGRISLFPDPEDPRFIVSLPPEYEGSLSLQEAVANKFNLPSGNLQFVYDDKHYKTR